jgi:hypothetical protein
MGKGGASKRKHHQHQQQATRQQQQPMPDFMAAGGLLLFSKEKLDRAEAHLTTGTSKEQMDENRDHNQSQSSQQRRMGEA